MNKHFHTNYWTDAELRKMVYYFDKYIMHINKNRRERAEIMGAYLVQCYTGLKYASVVRITRKDIQDKYLAYNKQSNAEYKRKTIMHKDLEDLFEIIMSIKRIDKRKYIFRLPSYDSFYKRMKYIQQEMGFSRGFDVFSALNTFLHNAFKYGADENAVMAIIPQDRYDLHRKEGGGYYLTHTADTEAELAKRGIYKYDNDEHELRTVKGGEHRKIENVIVLNRVFIEDMLIYDKRLEENLKFIVLLYKYCDVDKKERLVISNDRLKLLSSLLRLSVRALKRRIHHLIMSGWLKLMRKENDMDNEHIYHYKINKSVIAFKHDRKFKEYYSHMKDMDDSGFNNVKYILNRKSINDFKEFISDEEFDDKDYIPEPIKEVML